MRRKTKRGRLARPKAKLLLPDLEQAKAAGLLSLRSLASQRSCQHSVDEFVAWYCSEPRPSFNKTVVTRSRIHLPLGSGDHKCEARRGAQASKQPTLGY